MAALALFAGACTDDGNEAALLSRTSEVRTDLSCAQLTSATKDQLDAMVQWAGVASMGRFEDDVMMEAAGEPGGDSGQASTVAPAPPTADRASGADESAAQSPSAPAGQVVAGTNNQEAGVDEADIVKTDGRRIVSLVDGVLRVVDLDGSPAVDGALAVLGDGQPAQLFLRGDEALVVADSWGGVVPGGPGVIVDDLPVEIAPFDGDSAEGGAARPGAPPSTPPPLPETTTSVADPTTTVPGTAPATTTSTTTSTTSTTTSSSTTTTSNTTTTLPPAPVPPPVPFDQGVTLVRVDLTDPAGPTEVERTTVEGSLVAARMVDGTARVVVRSQPAYVQEMWNAGGIDDVRTVIADLEASDLLPRAVTADGDVATIGDCADVALLPAVSEQAMAADVSSVPVDPTSVSVLTVGAALADLAPVTVQGMAEVVYASTEALYITSTAWQGDGPATAVHRFATSGSEPATYAGSGTVPGSVLDQYSLSEADGDLRIVTTLDGMGIDEPIPVEPLPGPTPAPDPDVTIEPWEREVTPDIAPVPMSEGRLTVLRPEGDRLVEVGHVDDLGLGERVQSVRYVGDLAYVVTFRQTDPLYAIDLSDPTAPTVLGELKVTGFSQYLHPVGDGLLLGLGREATEQGGDLGLKVSLFDVSDPTAPVELDKVVVPDGWSIAADDPLAFTWDPVAHHAVFPLERYGNEFACPPEAECDVPPGGVEPFNGAMVVGVDGTDLVEVAELSHDRADQPWGGPILRSLVVDRDLWTLSQTGLGRSDADNPTEVDLVAF